MLTKLENDLNDAILSGDIMGAFEAFYADDVVMQENTSAPTAGKDANRERERAFVDSIAEFHGAEVTASAVGDHVSMSEWWMDVTFQDGSRKKLEQAVVRRWKDGKVVHERFYYDTAG